MEEVRSHCREERKLAVIGIRENKGPRRKV
jgi:hypothetical protein